MRCSRGLQALIVVTLLSSAWGGISHAQVTLGMEIDAGIPTGDAGEELKPGVGVQLRVGYRFSLPMLLWAEAIVDYSTFAMPNTDDAFADNLRLAAGVRIGPDIMFVPLAYAHVGYGNSALVFGQNNVNTAGGGFTWDAGIAIDLLRVPQASFGLHVAYKSTLLSHGNFNYIGAGIHGEIHF